MLPSLSRHALYVSSTERIANLEATLQQASPAATASAADLVDTLQHTVATLHAQLTAAANACDAAAAARRASQASCREAESERDLAVAEHGRAVAEMGEAREQAASTQRALRAAQRVAECGEAALEAQVALRVQAQGEVLELQQQLREIRGMLAALLQQQEERLQQQRELREPQQLLGQSLPVSPRAPSPPPAAALQRSSSPPQLSAAAKMLLAGRDADRISGLGGYLDQGSLDGAGGLIDRRQRHVEQPVPVTSSSMQAVASIGEQIAALRAQLVLKQGRISVLEGRHAEGECGCDQ